MADNQTSVLKVTRRDLEDPEVYRLNQVILHLQNQINSLKQDATITGNIKADSITTRLTDGVPADTDVVSWGTIKKYLSPAATQQAIVKNVWLGTPVRPITGIDIPATTSGIISAIIDTHALRLSDYLPSAYDVGSFYYETDRTSLYQVQSVGGTNAWVWIDGEMRSGFPSRPADLSTNDSGFLFRSTTSNALYLYRWDGSAWAVVNEFCEDATLSTYGNGIADYSTISIERSNGSIAAPASAVSGNVIGNVIFKALRNSSLVSSAAIHCEIESTPSVSTAAGKISIFTVDSTGSALTSRWSFTSDGDIMPSANNSYDVGSASLGVAKVWTNALNVVGGSVNDVLVNDGSDNAIWSSSGGGTTNSYLTANASATDTLTTSFADLTGCSLSLNQDGKWLVIGNFQFYKDANDNDCQGQLMFDGVAQLGGVRLDAVTADTARSMQTRCWVISFSGGPKTAKLRGRKASGAGTSTSESVNTSITAVYLST